MVTPFLVHLMVGGGAAGGGTHLKVTPLPASIVDDRGCCRNCFFMSEEQRFILEYKTFIPEKFMGNKANTVDKMWLLRTNANIIFVDRLSRFRTTQEKRNWTISNRQTNTAQQLTQAWKVQDIGFHGALCQVKSSANRKLTNHFRPRLSLEQM